MGNSLKEYILDILYGRTDPFVFKTAEFCKRNWNSIKHTLLHILYEFRKVKQGFRKLGGDIRYSVGFNKKLYSQKYNKVDVMAKYKVR